jgi:hypothetical protein
VSLILTAGPNFRLKQAELADNDDLRTWKNANRQHFFFKGEITPEMQAAWFTKLQTTPDDVMLMVQESDGQGFVNVGCMGFRKLADEQVIDVYNILRGRRLANSRHSMAEAFTLMNTWLLGHYNLPVTCKVLAANPARAWYEQNGFDLAGQGDHNGEPYVVYKLNPAKLKLVQGEASNL